MRPVSFFSSSGVNFPRLAKSFPRTVQVLSGSTRVMSASNPGAMSPRFFSPRSSAGFADIRAESCFRVKPFSFTRVVLQTANAVSSPLNPGEPSALSCIVCGAWSVAITSASPFFSACIRKFLSAWLLSGGFTMLKMFSPLEERPMWWGVTSQVTFTPRFFALITALRLSSVLTWQRCMWQSASSARRMLR